MRHSPSQRRTKGFIGIALLIVLAVVSVVFAGYELKKGNDVKLGAQVYTTQLSDTINTFRQQVNSSTQNLNTELSSVSSTVITHTSLLNLLPVANGGTGTSTAPSANQIFSANGTNPTWKSLTFGAGLNATNTATAIQIGTAGFDNTANINFTGTNAFTKPLALTTATSTASTSSDALNILPAGVVQAFAGPTSTTPLGWLICDGTSYATSTYPRLFSIIGYLYGGSGANFNVPNLQQSVILGLNTANASTSAIGQLGGATTTIIQQTNLPSLIPSISSPAQVIGGSGGTPGFSSVGANGGSNITFNQIGGSSTPMTNLPPYIVMQYIIKY